MENNRLVSFGFKSTCACAAVVLSLISQKASAQSSVTLYGLISTGLAYVSNAGGRNQWMFANGNEQGPRWGIKGREDLGGGYSAIFALENGFSVSNGTLANGGRLFGRQAFVGLTNDRLGTLTFGRQYDEMALQLGWAESANIYASIATHVGDNDNLYNTQRFNNAIRYQSPNLMGFNIAGSYAMSNSTSGFSDNSAFSLGMNYVRAPLKIGIAMSQFNHPASLTNSGAAVDSSSYGFSSIFTSNLGKFGVSSQRILGAGVTYDFGFMSATAVYTNVLFNYLDNTGLRLQNGELTLTHNFSPSWLVGTAYNYTSGEYSGGRRINYNQVNIGTVYSLSKRTDLFLVAIGQRAGGSASNAQIYSLSPSSTKNQFALESGIRFKF
jgi:general bacterial porin, GBP family